MDLLDLADEIINGRRLNKNDDLSFFIDCNLDELCQGADKIRKALVGDKVDLCCVISGKGGNCPENCKYCVQSAHNKGKCDVYDFIPVEKIVEECSLNAKEGVDRFSIVIAGRSLKGKDFDKAIEAYERMHKECDIDLCASLGFIDREQIKRLHEAGVTCYHHNIETSERYFPEICTTHTFEMKLNTIKMVKEEGMKICSGGIIGMGESWQDRIDMALCLSELNVDSIPINMLMPKEGTEFGNYEIISETDVMRTIAIFRFINPTANVRLAAGRSFYENDGQKAFLSGASASITGNYLTSKANANVRSDRKMLIEMGRKVREIL